MQMNKLHRALRAVTALALLAAVVHGCGGGGGGAGSPGAPATFSKSFGGPGNDEARAAIQTSDSGYSHNANDAASGRDHDSGGWAGSVFARSNHGRGDFADDEATEVWPLLDGGFVVAARSVANITAAGGGRVHIDAVSVV